MAYNVAVFQPFLLVDLIVSKGSHKVNVPDVVGLPKVEAETRFLESNLLVDTTIDVHSNTVPSNHIISQRPEVGSSVLYSTSLS